MYERDIEMAGDTKPRSDFYVYVLFRTDGSPFYVGKGRGRRWESHEREESGAVRSHNPRKIEVVRQTLAARIDIPKVKIAEGLTNKQALAIEAVFISALGREPDGPLVNRHPRGGGMSDPPSDETRVKLRLINLGRVRSPETRAKVSKAKKGYVPSDEWRALMSVMMTGRTHTDEARAKMSAMKTGKPGANKGIHLSDEHKAKLGAVQRRVAAAKRRKLIGDLFD
jgi:hypothetical protein